MTARGTRTLRLDADPETTAMILHAAARGAVRLTDGTIGALACWPSRGNRATVLVDRRHLRPHYLTVDPVCCGNCHAPASPDLVRRGLDLCAGCSEATA